MKSKATQCLIAAALALVGLANVPAVRADVVTDWNATLGAALRASTDPNPAQARKAAIVQVAVFDAVNGIARKYQPYFVADPAPGGARQEAAAAQAAYTALLALYPPQKATFDAQLAATLAALAGSRGDSQSIARGRVWGEFVADAILARRSTDGFSAACPNYFGGDAIGQWRSVPDGTRPASLPCFGSITPFALISGAQFRPGPPPALTSAEYAADFNEVKALGRRTGSTRTPEQTDLALLWQATAVPGENAVARSVVPLDASLVDKARLFALVNIAACDAFIIGPDCKFTYGFWRPYHAIRNADLDPNPATNADPDWDSLIQPVPNHPEYMSFHSVFTGAFMRVLAHLLGDNHSFTLTAPTLPGVSREYSSFSQAVDEVKEARIWGGLHFRTSCDVGHEAGYAFADYLVANFLLPLESEDEQ